MMNQIIGGGFLSPAPWGGALAGEAREVFYKRGQLIMASDARWLMAGPPGRVGRIGRWLVSWQGWLQPLGAAKASDRLDPRLASLAESPESCNLWDGEFTLAALDPQRERLILLRDGFGQSPLYYTALTAGGWAWSTSLDFLFALRGSEPPPDQGSMFDYLATHYRHVFKDPGRTFHQGVRQVPAGHYAALDLVGDAEEISWAGWSLPSEAAAYGPEEASAKFLALLTRAVRRRLKPKGAPAFTVSSGLDSSTVALLAAREMNKRPVWYSVGYQGDDYDETPGVKLLAALTGAELRLITLKEPPVIDGLEEAIPRQHSPFATATWFAHYHLAAQVAQDGFNRLFTGLGGDESLAGEFEHFFYFFADLKINGHQERLSREIEGWRRLHDHPVFKKNPGVVSAYWADQIDFDRPGLIRVDQKRLRAYLELFEPEFVHSQFSEPPMPCPYQSYLANRLYQEIRYETTPPSLWGEALASRAWGLLGTAPFLNQPLIKLGLALNPGLKYDNGLTKMVLRRAAAGLLPDQVRLNPGKIGFNAPFNRWLQGPLGAQVKDILASESFRRRGWLKPGRAERLLEEHLSGAANHMMILWPLLNAEIFSRTQNQGGRWSDYFQPGIRPAG